MLPGGGDKGASKVSEKKERKEKVKVEQVYISKQRKQCEDETGKALAVTKDELQAAGIEVITSECGVITGIMGPALCGSMTLDINIHGIDERKIPEAEALGYKSVESFEGEEDYEPSPCE